ncbi:oligosaccharide repeat unit polymerase [Chryseobacterium indologenes]|uniref:Oligosaccharide repeat unit polymerase n=3 Tax=Chryseobacterium indologenes TaxID=253 RepID=A0AAD0YVQ0_CHRID|nr:MULTISPECIES: O-antigen polymerase [Chryseobacterium]ASE62441.2 oligosaccharide repeat unit polymerase [Chryseobacterium indologenes]ATN06275.1 oligosaccharide repeat unit polymerase [Chryseobacterium indologenes]AYZ34634.1 oligosaccharide repeat unit polymerase [Chryseobacterium indologenes]AZB18155.1 oligosaccharide repeat unit polymerase [Chryseobacterium indologenes]MEB4758956.1 O-antigen ligase [Chryseobacterium indologenes]
MYNTEIDIKKIKKIFAIGYCVIFLTFYCIIPIFFMGSSVDKNISETLGGITLLSVFGFLMSFFINFFPNHKQKYLVINGDTFSKCIFIIYILVVLLIIATAGELPILASLRGASQEDLFGLREGFLKDRKGFEIIFSYLITIIDSTFFPFVIVRAFFYKKKSRFLYLLVFVLYSISFLEKGYFLKIAIPVFFFLYYKSKNKKTYLIVSCGVILALISLMFLLSKFDAIDASRDEPFFSIYHIPTTIFEAVVWRMVAVPVITAYQGLELFFSNEFHGEYLYGATSSLLSSIFGLERINFERALYQSQFGGSETGNANQFYLIEAFINYGYLGVFLFSFLLGKMVKDMINTKNIAVICIIPLLFYNLFSSGLIGNLLSNGYLLFYLMVIYVRFK